VAKAFSVASWNVEHFKNKGPSNAERLEFLAGQKPDVIAIYEVEGSEVWRELIDKFPRYSFFITEGSNTQEILVGIGPGVTGFLTQKIEFQSGISAMRPGAFLTVRAHGEEYALLFLHVASWPEARGFGLRADMIERAFAFKEVLDKVAGGKANYVFMGDLNTMGMDYVYGREPAPSKKLLHARVSAEQEIERLHHLAAGKKMRVLSKNADATWGSARGMRSNLDHVVATASLRFKTFTGAEVDVRGWPKLDGKQAQGEWMGRYSDHALLYFEVQRPA
jgi:hypothetical protein